MKPLILLLILMFSFSYPICELLIVIPAGFLITSEKLRLG